MSRKFTSAVILRDLVRRIEGLDFLDGISDKVSGVVTAVVRPAKSVLSGTWLGHPLHPLLTDLPIGFWTSAVALDLLGGGEQEDAVERLVGLGALAALPTVASGASDWADTYGPERRVGVVHALAMGTGLALFVGSLLPGARARSMRLLGLTSVTAGGYLGGHLSFAQGVGVDHQLFADRPEDWTDAMPADQLEEAKPTMVEAGGARVLLYRQGRRILAIAATCSHAGGPLHEGVVDEALCVTCPWHGSRFRLAGGSVVRGPAWAPQTAYQTRTLAGMIQVRAGS